MAGFPWLFHERGRKVSWPQKNIVVRAAHRRCYARGMAEPLSRTQAQECQLIELMVAYQAGDPGAFEQLYAVLADEACRYFARAHRDRGVARDLTQDLFLEIHRSRRSYTPPLPVRPWIFGIARNVLAR